VMARQFKHIDVEHLLTQAEAFASDKLNATWLAYVDAKSATLAEDFVCLDAMPRPMAKTGVDLRETCKEACQAT